jgi:hypothetical protein
MAAQTNYTAEMTAQAIEMYEAGTAIEEIAEAIGKGVRSVRSKLVREGVYIAPEKPAKTAKVEGPTKKEMLNELESLAPFAVDGLMGATKAAIADLIDYVKAQETDSNEMSQEDEAELEETQPEEVEELDEVA